MPMRKSRFTEQTDHTLGQAETGNAGTRGMPGDGGVTEQTYTIDSDPLRHSTQGGEPGHDRHHLLAGDALTHLDGEALAAVIIDHGERPDAAAVEQRVGDEVHRPAFIYRPGRRPTRYAAITWRRGRLSRMLSPSCR